MTGEASGREERGELWRREEENGRGAGKVQGEGRGGEQTHSGQVHTPPHTPMEVPMLQSTTFHGICSPG